MEEVGEPTGGICTFGISSIEDHGSVLPEAATIKFCHQVGVRDLKALTPLFDYNGSNPELGGHLEFGGHLNFGCCFCI